MEPIRNDIRFCFMQEKQQDGTNLHKLYVYDSIRARGPFNWETWQYEASETSAKYFRDRLNEIPTGEPIELHVNSQGGEVGEGVTIFNLLKQKREAGSHITAYVDGTAYSVAMDIVMAANDIHMGLGTTMFLHNPWMYCSGNAEQLRNYADQLDSLAAASLQLYLARSGGKISQEELKDMMDKETMLDPETCLKYGFCDVIDTFRAEAEEDDPEDDPEEVMQELRRVRNELFRQQEVNRMLQGLKKDAEPEETGNQESMKTIAGTFLAAMKNMHREVRK